MEQRWTCEPIMLFFTHGHPKPDHAYHCVIHDWVYSNLINDFCVFATRASHTMRGAACRVSSGVLQLPATYPESVCGGPFNGRTLIPSDLQSKIVRIGSLFTQTYFCLNPERPRRHVLGARDRRESLSSHGVGLAWTGTVPRGVSPPARRGARGRPKSGGVGGFAGYFRSLPWAVAG